MRKIACGIICLLLGFSAVGLSQQNVDTGNFYFQLNQDAGVENFTYTQLANGNFQLVSNFQALSDQLILDFGTDKIFTETVIFTPDFNLVSYNANSETDRGTLEIDVTVKDQVASIHQKRQAPGETAEERQRDVILEDNVVTTGIAASQFLLLQQYINEKLKLDISKETTLNAFDPTDINNPLVELTIKHLPDVIVQDVKTQAKFTAHRYEVSQDSFKADLISCSAEAVAKICDKEGRFLGFISSTASLAGVELDNAPNASGALVKSVADGSFAAQAGLKVGDIITEVDGKAVRDRLDVGDLIRFKDPSVPVTFTVFRNGGTMTLQVRLSGSFLTVFRFDLFEGGFTILGEA
ncbi:PDZ domain-containing protein [Candidatus Acetothermia bacterium]|nr:PDZ domain-containing protein [Candidatus Acetothermia bacterium]MBI3642963.1 PDZ domain-containing protein [Candidatus Acetothermia bacterium]